MRTERVLNFAEGALRTLFWVLLLLGFDEGGLSLLTLLAAALHEGGHLLAARILRLPVGAPRSVPNGLLLPVGRPRSYREEILTAAAGPAANFLSAVGAALLAPLVGGTTLPFALVSLLTGLSNLLPADGYDGQKILSALLSEKRGAAAADKITECISFAVAALFTFFSLFLILYADAGYFLFGVFFLSLTGMIRRRVKSDVF